MRIDPVIIIPCCLKWIDVVDDLLAHDDQKTQQDLEQLTLEPFHILYRAFTERLKQFNVDSVKREPMEGDWLTRKRAYITLIEELSVALQKAKGDGS